MHGGPGALRAAASSLQEVDCLNVESSWLGDAVQFRLEVSWSSETADKADRLRATVQAKPLVEMAATALALVIVHHVVHLGQLDVTNYGDRTDFRSTRISCMLEVSGTETRSELARRHRQKVAQALRNPFGWDAYVVVCAFSSQGHRGCLFRGERPATSAILDRVDEGGLAGRQAPSMRAKIRTMGRCSLGRRPVWCRDRSCGETTPSLGAPPWPPSPTATFSSACSLCRPA